MNAPEPHRSKNRVAGHIARLPKSGIRDFFELVNTMDDVISLGVGEPDFVTPWNIREATIYALEKGHTQYTSNLGLLSARQAICDYTQVEFGARYDPVTECIVTVGVSEALDLALRALVEPGDEVIYHEPCYVSYKPCIAMLHGVPVAVSTVESDGFALDPEQLAAAVTSRTKAIILNFPNNPTGAGLSPAQKQRIAEIAIEHDLVVITDEIYRELTYGEVSDCIATLQAQANQAGTHSEGTGQGLVSCLVWPSTAAGQNANWRDCQTNILTMSLYF